MVRSIGGTQCCGPSGAAIAYFTTTLSALRDLCIKRAVELLSYGVLEVWTNCTITLLPFVSGRHSVAGSEQPVSTVRIVMIPTRFDSRA